MTHVGCYVHHSSLPVMLSLNCFTAFLLVIYIYMFGFIETILCHYNINNSAKVYMAMLFIVFLPITKHTEGLPEYTPFNLVLQDNTSISKIPFF